MNSLRNYIGLLLVIFSIMAINASAEPGIIEGTGTHFEMNDSEYINIILNSSESIGLILESTPEMVTMDITPITGSGTSTDITLKGFSPTTTYHKYEDNYDSHVIFTTDENGSYTYTQDLLDTHTIYIQPRPSTIHIEDIVNGRDCTSVGTWSTSSKTCTLTTDLSQSIEIDSNNILLDGNGHTAAGTNTGNGILIRGHTGVIVKNLRITNFNRGIDLTESDNNNIKGNTIYGNQRAIRLSKSHNNLIYNNLFDNYNNNFLSDSDNNVWNMAKTLGTNIVGGIYLGGNFWDNPSRFSRTCTDSGDGICDSIYTLDTTNIDNLPLATYVSDTAPPNSVDNLHNITYAQTYINWTWTNPTDLDFDHVDVYVDSGPIVSVGSAEFYNATGLLPDTEHTIHTRTVDTTGNVNATWKNHIARTSSVPDTTPPASVTDLHNLTPGTTFIEWVWTNPADSDFDHVEIYIDGIYKENVMSTASPYYAIGSLDPDTEHEISTRTVDSSGNINYTWKNHTARTAPIPIIGPVHNINKGIDYSGDMAIRRAVNEANPGDTILVDSGRYFDTVPINKQLTLRGVPTDGTKPVIYASVGYAIYSRVISIYADGVVVEGFEIRDASDFGIYLQSNSSIIRNNTVVNNGNSDGGLPGGYGIYMLDSSHNYIDNNYVNSNGLTMFDAGIYVIGLSNYNSITNNIVESNPIGIILIDAPTNNVLDHNTASSNANNGIYLNASSSNTLDHNTVNDNTNNGIYIESDSSSNTIVYNTASNNRIGILLSLSNNNQIENNSVLSNNGRGIYVSNTYGNAIYNNNFNNAQNILLAGTNNNVWNTTETPGTNIIGGINLGGNYWAQPDGYGFSQTCNNVDSDGICDSGYRLNGEWDYLPLTNRDTSTPLISTIYYGDRTNPVDTAINYNITP